MTEDDIAKANPSQVPTEGAWIVTDSGRIVPANYRNEHLEWICDIQLAPNGPRNQSILCAAGLMFRALKVLQQDPKFKRLSPQTLEAVNEAITAAE